MTEQEYSGLYGEIVTEDVYGMRKLDFVPDVIIDVGACVGIFTEFASSLFPDATIIAIEPNPGNFKSILSRKNVFLINAAIGMGDMYHGIGAVNGAHECYYSFESIVHMSGKWEPFLGERMMLNDIRISGVVSDGDKVVVKIDIENAEGMIFSHRPSVDFLRKADYVAVELHDCPYQVAVAIALMKDTHLCEFDRQIFKARKR